MVFQDYNDSHLVAVQRGTWEIRASIRTGKMLAPEELEQKSTTSSDT